MSSIILLTRDQEIPDSIFIGGIPPTHLFPLSSIIFFFLCINEMHRFRRRPPVIFQIYVPPYISKKIRLHTKIQTKSINFV